MKNRNISLFEKNYYIKNELNPSKSSMKQILENTSIGKTNRRGKSVITLVKQDLEMKIGYRISKFENQTSELVQNTLKTNKNEKGNPNSIEIIKGGSNKGMNNNLVKSFDLRTSNEGNNDANDLMTREVLNTRYTTDADNDTYFLTSVKKFDLDLKNINLNPNENYDKFGDQIYMMIDYAGILDCKNRSNSISFKDDLIMDRNKANRIIYNGMKIIKFLNRLQKEMNLNLIFHSDTAQEEQVSLIKLLKSTCEIEKLNFPEIFVIAVRDKNRFPSVLSSNPKIIKDKFDNIVILGYSEHINSKTCVRNAFSSYFKIINHSRKFHYIIDDEPSVIEKAKREGWKGYLISQENSLDQVLKEIYSDILQKQILTKEIDNYKNLFFTNILPTEEFKISDKLINEGSSVSIQIFINDKSEKLWIGKVSGLKGLGGYDQNDKIINPDSLDEFKEYLAIKLYSLFGVLTPNVCLSEQEVSNNCKLIFEDFQWNNNYNRIHFMSEIVEDFKSLGNKFMEEYNAHSQNGTRNEYFHIDGKPLLGFGQMLAVGCFIDDYDCCGNSGGNAGYVDKDNMYKRLVKIDAGEAMSFLNESAIVNNPKNRIIRVGTQKDKNISFENLNKMDKKEFAYTAKKIMEFPDIEFKEIFKNFIKIDSDFKEELKFLLERKANFLEGFSLEIRQLIKKEIQKLNNEIAEMIEDDNNDDIINIERRISSIKILKINELKLGIFNKYKYQIPNRNSKFIGRELQLKKIYDLLYKKGIATITGSGGVGKSSLAIEYVYLYEKDYSCVIWLYAEYGLLIAQIKSYLEKINPNSNILNKTEIDIIRNFYDILNKSKSLIVFDNVENFDSLDGFINIKSPHILITSRYTNWDSKITLKTFSDDLAKKFFKKNFLIDKNIEENEVEKLNSILGGLPLALCQATSFINLHNLNSLSEYFELFESEKYNLLGEKSQYDEDISTISTTFTLALKNIKKKNDDIESILSLIAYLSADNLNIEILEKYFEKDLKEAIKILVEYSILTLEKDKLIINRITQTVIRRTHSIRQILFENYKNTYKWIYNQLIYDHKNEEFAKRASDIIPHALSLAEINDDSIPINLIADLNSRIAHFQLYFARNYNQSKICYEKALSLRESIYGPEDPKLIGTLANLGNLYKFLGDNNKKKELLLRALKISRINNGDDPDTASIMSTLGNLYRDMGDYKKSLEYLENAFEINQTYYGSDHPHTALIMANLANLFRDLGNYEKSNELIFKAYEIFKLYYGKEHHDTARLMSNVAAIYRESGDHTKAKELLNEALNILENLYGKDHPETANILSNLGNIYVELGDVDESLRLLQRALNIKEKQFGSENAETADTIINLGIVLLKSKDFEKSEYYILKGYEIIKRLFGEDHYTTAIAASNVGLLYMNNKNYDKSRELFLKAIEIIEENHNKDHPELIKIKRLLNTSEDFYLKMMDDDFDYINTEEDLFINSARYSLVNPIRITMNKKSFDY